MTGPARIVFVFVALALLGTGAISHAQDAPGGHDPHAAHRNMMRADTQVAPSGETIEVPDKRLVAHTGEKFLLSSELIGDRIVVLDFVYTTCTTVCPVLSAILSQVQRDLGDRLGKDVILVSITVDPLRDTPQRLASYAQKMKAADGWYWLTGPKLDVDDVLKSLGVYTPNFADHPSVVLVGDAGADDWSRFVGFPGATQIVSRINELTAAREAQSAVTE